MIEGSGTAGTVRRDPSTPIDAVLPRDAALDRLAALAADLLATTAAGIAMVVADRLRVVAGTGLDGMSVDWPLVSPLSETASRVIPDAFQDVVFRDHPLVAGPPQARFLATSPLLSGDGALVGLLFVADAAARPAASPSDVGRLMTLAALARDIVDARRAVKRAEAGSEARSGLLADVSHELRTPLNGIVGFTQLLKRDASLGETARGNVERIEEAGRGLLGIVEDGLDVSRLESGLVRLQAKPFSAERLLEDCVAMVRPDAEQKGLRLSLDLPAARVADVVGDPDRLRQVLLNLLSNAVKFTGSGDVGARLAFDATNARPETVVLCFAVEDSGMGIASDGIPRLFNRFVQADRSVARRFGGSGLGLAISKTLVEAMGGTIEVESSPGVGTRFSVTLTLPRVSERRGEDPQQLSASRPDSLRGLAILLAEDAPLNQKLVVQMLAPLGATIDVVADGVAAVTAAETRDYALVLMDMEMPVMGGLDATRRIRALPGAAGRVPIVALTANVYPEQLDMCRAAGMDDHLTKPFGPDDLARVALRWSRRLKAAL